MGRKLEVLPFVVTLGSVILFILPTLALIFSSSPIAILRSLVDIEFLKSLKVSFLCAFLSSFLILLFGTPFAYLLARNKIPFSKLLETLSEIPAGIPHSVAGIALLYLFGNLTIPGRILNLLGVNFSNSYLGIILAMVFVSAPFFVIPVRESFSRIPDKYEKISHSLGRGKIFTFFKVLVPMARHEIIKGFSLSFGRALSEFGAIMIVAYFPMTATVFIYEKLESMGIRVALPYALIMLLISGGIFTVLKLIPEKHVKDRKS
ncbi:MAG: ABC transporter permease [candidate division WOR-3 bacterium]